MGNIAAEAVQVAVGIATAASGEVLVAQRPAGKRHGGEWEFPGGKLMDGESPEAALRREWKEELDVPIDVLGPECRFHHDYEHGRVELICFQVRMRGEPRPLEGQRIQWIRPADFGRLPFVAGDRHLLTRLQLPRTYLVSQAQARGCDEWLRDLERLLVRGIRLVQLREPGLDDTTYANLAERCELLCRRHGAELLLNRSIEWLEPFTKAGVHLSAAAARGIATVGGAGRFPGRRVAVSAHHAEELDLARDLGADFVTLSPVLPTLSHPGCKHLGWNEAERLIRDCPLPVFLQGGMTPAHLAQARRVGAHGVSFMRAADDLLTG